MRKLITGVDSHGRSCVVEAVDIEPATVGGDRDVRVARIHTTLKTPPPRVPVGGGTTEPSWGRGPSGG